MGKLVKNTRKFDYPWWTKRYRRYGTLIFFRASRKVRSSKRNGPHFELSGCCSETCLFPTLTCDKCHMEY